MAKKTIGRRPTGNLVEEIDAAIALLTRVRALAVSTAVSDGTGLQATKQAPAGKRPKRVLSSESREAIATAQKKRIRQSNAPVFVEWMRDLLGT